MSTPVLTTGRLTLRPPVAGDAQAIADVLNNWDVSQWLSRVPFPYALADAEAFLGWLAESADRLYWVIEINGRVEGAVSLLPDLGFFLAPRAHGKGYITEASRAVIDWYFTQTEEPMISGYQAGNGASWRVQEKLGFHQTHSEVVLKAATGKEVTVFHTALSKAHWEASDV